jgi:hypothetical protein
VQPSSQQHTDLVKRFRRSITVAAATVIVAGLSWLGLRQYRSRIACEERSAAFARQVKSIEQDAHERLNIGTKGDNVSRFFAEHGIPFTIVESEAIGTLPTSGCAPLGCGKDSALIGVHVKLDRTGTVTGEPSVVGLYTDCM